MINQKIQDAINAQINREQYSAQLYLAMSAHCEAKSFRGFAHWLRLQAARGNPARHETRQTSCSIAEAASSCGLSGRRRWSMAR